MLRLAKSPFVFLTILSLTVPAAAQDKATGDLKIKAQAGRAGTHFLTQPQVAPKSIGQQVIRKCRPARKVGLGDARLSPAAFPSKDKLERGNKNGKQVRR
jgi:hypothetical protein